MDQQITVTIGFNEETSCLLREFVSRSNNNQLLQEINNKLDRVIRKEKIMSKELDALTAEVTRNTKVDQSAIALLEGLAAKIEAIKADPVALQALADSMKSDSDKLAAAVLANTPADPEATA